jgi:hypothetical protein
MHAGAVTGGLPFVTVPAIHRLGRKVVVRMLIREIHVATGARVGAVRGGGQFGGVHEQQNLFAARVGLGEGFVRVAFQTITVLQCRWRGEREDQAQANSEQLPQD